MKRFGAGCLAIAVALAAGSAAADAASVAYIDRGGVWVSSLDGKQKRRVEGKTRDGRRWTELAQADNGRILAVRRPPHKVPNLNSTTLWGPTGKRIYQGSLGYQTGWTSYAYPLSVDLTADGRNVVYGYSVMNYGYPVSQLQTGTWVQYADRTPAAPFAIVDQEWPTTVGKRLVTASDSQVNVQNATGQPPFVLDFTGWLDTGATGLELKRTDVAANGKVAAIELAKWHPTNPVGRIVMARIPRLGGLMSASCFLPTKGEARQPSLSQDGRSVAWQDRRGVVVSGTPTFTGSSDTCRLTRGVKVISKTGEYPSIGGAKVVIRKKRRR